MDCLIRHPSVGSIWLTRCEVKNRIVTGEFFDTSDCGSSYLPIDYPGEWQVMNFPVSCIVKQIIHEAPPHPRNPYLAVDAIVRVGAGGQIILINRKNPPFGLALPGGFVEYGESVEDAIRREIMEETNVNLISLEQFHTYSKPNRDPRQHVVSVVFLGWTVDTPRAGDDASDIVLANTWELEKYTYVFDHKQILGDWSWRR